MLPIFARSLPFRSTRFPPRSINRSAEPPASPRVPATAAGEVPARFRLRGPASGGRPFRNRTWQKGIRGIYWDIHVERKGGTDDESVCGLLLHVRACLPDGGSRRRRGEGGKVGGGHLYVQ